MGTLYNEDVLRWAEEQAALLREGRLELIDVQHVAEEIADLVLRERHELAHRFAILLCHLLKWQRQPERRGRSWRNTLRDQRNSIDRLVTRIPSLKHVMGSADWQHDVWGEARIKAVHEAGFDYDALPDAWPWSFEQVRSQEFFPDSG